MSDAPVTLETREARLHFASPVPAPADAPRLLLVSYHFPPDPVVGGLRWQEMSRYFISLGWAVDVIARDFRDVEHLDPARLAHFGAHLRLFSVGDREPAVERAQKIVWPVIRRLLSRGPVQRVDALTHHEVKGQSSGGRGLVRGGAMVSEKHCNFLLNTGEATAADIEGLGEELRVRVKAMSGVELEWEIKRIGVAARKEHNA